MTRKGSGLTLMGLALASVPALIAGGLSFVFLDTSPLWTHIGVSTAALALFLPFGRRLAAI